MTNKKILSLDELIKALEGKGIKYDKRELEEPYFPLEDIEACLDRKMTAMPNHLPCPLCGKPSEQLEWIYFHSPQWTWQNLMGRGGPMSICPDCRCVVEFILHIMN